MLEINVDLREQVKEKMEKKVAYNYFTIEVIYVTNMAMFEYFYAKKEIK